MCVCPLKSPCSEQTQALALSGNGSSPPLPQVGRRLRHPVRARQLLATRRLVRGPPLTLGGIRGT